MIHWPVGYRFDDYFELELKCCYKNKDNQMSQQENFLTRKLRRLERKLHVSLVRTPLSLPSPEEQKRIDDEENAFIKKQNEAEKALRKQKKQFKEYMKEEYQKTERKLVALKWEKSVIKKTLKEFRNNQRIYYRRWLEMQDMGIIVDGIIYTLAETKKDYQTWMTVKNKEMGLDSDASLRDVKSVDLAQVFTSEGR